MILIFFGPPGAGKGTQAKFVAEKLNIVHLSTGDILREQLLKKNKLSIELKNIMDSGQLVTDSILNNIIYDRLNEKDCFNGFILDGYPRTMDQAIFLNKTLQERNLAINYILDFIINEETIIKRIKARSIIENRGDDNEDVIKTRIANYYNATKPLSNFYKSELVSAYRIIDSNQEIQKLNTDILKIIKKH